MSFSVRWNKVKLDLNAVVCHFRQAHNPSGTQIHCDSVGPINQKLFSFIARPLRDWVN